MSERAGDVGSGVPLMGLDAWGRYWFTLRPPHLRRFVAFVVRARSLASDLRFWRSVAVKSSVGRGTYLAAYCDGAACVAAARELGRQPFPVIAFGLPAAYPALARADEEGDFLVLGPREVVRARAPWRGTAVSPAAVAKEVSR